MLVTGVSNVLSKISIDKMCIDALVSTLIIKRGTTFHPMVAMLLRSDWYLSIFFL